MIINNLNVLISLMILDSTGGQHNFHDSAIISKRHCANWHWRRALIVKASLHDSHNNTVSTIN